MDEVRAQAERMVPRTEIVRQANQVAQRILDDANEEARRMRHEAEDYCDQKLAGMEIVLDRIMRTVQSGREKLQATAARRRAEAAGRRGSAPTRPRTASSTRTTDLDRTVEGGAPCRSTLRRPRGPAPPSRRGTRWHEVRTGPVDPDGVIAGRVAGDSPVPEGAEAVCDVDARVLRRRRDGDRHGPGPLGGGLPALHRPGRAASWRSRCGSASPSPVRRYGDPTTRRPTRSSTTSSTSSPWSATPSSSSCPWPRCAGRTAPGLCPKCGADRNEERLRVRGPERPAVG